MLKAEGYVCAEYEGLLGRYGRKGKDGKPTGYLSDALFHIEGQPGIWRRVANPRVENCAELGIVVASFGGVRVWLVLDVKVTDDLSECGWTNGAAPSKPIADCMAITRAKGPPLAVDGKSESKASDSVATVAPAVAPSTGLTAVEREIIEAENRKSALQLPQDDPVAASETNPAAESAAAPIVDPGSNGAKYSLHEAIDGIGSGGSDDPLSIGDGIDI